MLQDDAIIRKIRSDVTNRILKALAEMAKDKPEQYDAFTTSLGDFLKEGETMVMASIDDSTGTILTAEAPVKVVLQVTYTEPGLKGDTATNATKPATLETGVEIRVPLFINEGDMIEVDTRDASYVTRK